MDFLEIPQIPGVQHIQIPYLATLRLTYDCRFTEFPERHGFRHNGRFQSDRPIDEIRGFLQSWLYFGLLSELAGEELDPEDFKILNDQGNVVVGTGHLRGALIDLVVAQHYRKLSIPGPNREYVQRQQRRHIMPIGQCIKVAQEDLVQVETSLSTVHSHSLDLIVLSVRALVEFLTPSDVPPVSRGLDIVNPTSRALREAMLKGGWCIHHWHQVCCSSNVMTAYYLSAMPRRTNPLVSHVNCTESSCVGWNLSSNASNMHTTPDCKCAMTGVSTDKLSSIVSKGKIPLVSIHTSPTGDLSLKLEAWNGWTPYTAISHVWADGLGNSNENALPQCQIQRLKPIVDNLPLCKRRDDTGIGRVLASTQKRLFWLDILCVPISHSDSAISETHGALDVRIPRLKKIAIDSMSMIYANALPALVLDYEICSLSSTASSDLKLAYVSYCGWTTRAWTLQEGSLSRIVLFALADGFFDPEDIYLNRNKRLASSHLEKPSRLSSALSGCWSEQRIPFHDIDPTSYKTWEGPVLRCVWNGLNRRQTTQAEDLPLILANLTGLVASGLNSQANAVATIITSFRSIPVGFLFDIRSRLQHTSRRSRAGSQKALSGSISSRSVPSVPSKSDIEAHFRGILNAWLPTQIGGFNFPAGPAMRVKGNVLELPRFAHSEHSDGDCEMLSTFTTQNIPSKFILKSTTIPRRSMVVTTYHGIPNETLLHELENSAIGFCFVLESRAEAVAQSSITRKGALLAIIDQTSDRWRTIFHSAVRVEDVAGDMIPTPNHMPALVADSVSSVYIELLFDPGQFVQLTRSRGPNHTGPSPLRQLAVIGFYSTLGSWPTIAALFNRHTRVLAVLVVTGLILHTIASMMLRSRVLRQRIIKNFRPGPLTFKNHCDDVLYIASDHLLYSAIFRLPVFLACIWTCGIKWGLNTNHTLAVVVFFGIATVFTASTFFSSAMASGVLFFFRTKTRRVFLLVTFLIFLIVPTIFTIFAKIRKFHGRST